KMRLDIAVNCWITAKCSSSASVIFICKSIAQSFLSQCAQHTLWRQRRQSDHKALWMVSFRMREPQVRSPGLRSHEPYSDTCQLWSDLRYRRAMLSVSPGVEVDAAHFLEAEVGADGRGGRPVRLEDSGFQAHGTGISHAWGPHRGIDPIATVCVESGRALHHRDGAIGERKHARDRN